MSHQAKAGLTECGTNASRAIAKTFGKCTLCPTWRKPQDLINGLCFEHRIWDPPRKIKAKQKETKT